MTLIENRTIIVFFVIILIVLAFIFWLALKITNWLFNNQEAKREKEHPELYQLIDKVNKKGVEVCHWYNQQIAPKKKQIDRLIEEMPYYPKEVKTQKEEELERLREEVYTATNIKKVLNDELYELRKQVHEYIENHNVKWAKDWEW